MGQLPARITERTGVEVFLLFADGHSPEQICEKLGLTMVIVEGFIKSIPFREDMKKWLEEIEVEMMYSPKMRVKLMQHRALDVLGEEMEKKNGKFRVQAADSILDRAQQIPKTAKAIQASEDIPAEALQFVGTVLRELGTGIGKGIAAATTAAADPLEDAIDVSRVAIGPPLSPPQSTQSK